MKKDLSLNKNNKKSIPFNDDRQDESRLLGRIYEKIMPAMPFYLDSRGRVVPGANLLLAARAVNREKMIGIYEQSDSRRPGEEE